MDYICKQIIDAMEPNPRFKVIFLKEAAEFILSLDQKVRNKINYNIIVSQHEIDKVFFKKLKGTEIWEFRTLYNGICYRLLAFWDTESEALVLATHGFIKKTQKTPNNEIAKANRIRNDYFENKNK